MFNGSCIIYTPNTHTHTNHDIKAKQQHQRQSSSSRQFNSPVQLHQLPPLLLKLLQHPNENKAASYSSYLRVIGVDIKRQPIHQHLVYADS